MTGWIRFFISAVFIVTGLVSFAAGVIGNCRFGYVMNRVHAGGIGDTQGLFFIVMGLAHFLSQVEYYTNPNLYDHMKRK